MALSKRPNRFYPSIPGITEDQRTHTNALQQMRESIETHERRNSNYRKSFIRWEELVDLGIIDDDGNFILELGTDGGGGTGATLLGELDDVNVPAPVDNDFLVWDDATQMWTAQTATEAGIATTEEIITLLSELEDINITGGQIYDLLYLAGTEWEPTKGALQFNGTNLYVPTGGIYFRSVGSGGSFVSGDISEVDNLDLSSLKDIWLDATRNVRFDTTDGLFDVDYGLTWQHGDTVPRRHLELTTTIPQGITPDPNLGQVSLLVTAENAAVNSGTFTSDVGSITWNYTNGDPLTGAEVGYVSDTSAKHGTKSIFCKGETGATFEGFVGPAQNSTAALAFYPTGLQEFTYEFWIDPDDEYTGLNPDGRWNNAFPILSGWNDQNAGAQSLRIECDNTGRLDFAVPTATGVAVVLAQVATGQSWNSSGWVQEGWHHWAIVRESDGELRAYFDGVLRAVTGQGLFPSVATVQIVQPTNTQTMNFGCNQRNGQLPNGQGCAAYVDDLRLTKGVARYLQGSAVIGDSVFAPPGELDVGITGEELTVGDPGYPIVLDGSRVSLKNSIPITWENESQEIIEHAVFTAAGGTDNEIGSVTMLLTAEEAAVGSTSITSSIGGITWTEETGGTAECRPVDTFAKSGTQSISNTSVLPGINIASLHAPFGNWCDFGVGDFTIEAHVLFEPGFNPNVHAIMASWIFTEYSFIFQYQPSTAANGVRIGWLHTSDGTTGTQQGFTGVIVNGTYFENTWYHVAVTRQNGVVRLFWEGTQYGGDITGTNAVFVPTTHDVELMASNNHNSNVAAGSYYDDIRVTKGVARYTADFTPPEPPYDIVGAQDTLILGDPVYPILLDGSKTIHKNSIGFNWENDALERIELLNFTDDTPGTYTTVLDGSTATTITDSVRLASYAEGYPVWDFLGNDFTMEFWGYWEDLGTSDYYFLSRDWSFSGQRVWYWRWDRSIDTFQFVFTIDGTTRQTANFGGAPSAGVWHFFQLRREGANLQMFIDGVQNGSTFNIGSQVIFPYSQASFNFCRIGNSDQAFGPFRGKMQELRITKGIARPTTVPTKAFPRGFDDDNWQNVILCMSFDDRLIQGPEHPLDTGDDSVYGQIITISDGFSLSSTTIKWPDQYVADDLFFTGDPAYPQICDAQYLEIRGNGLEVFGGLIVGENSFFTGDIAAFADMDVQGSVIIGTDLTVWGAEAEFNSLVDINGFLTVSSTATFSGLVEADADLHVTDELRVYDTGGTDYISDTHTGNIAIRDFVNTETYRIQNADVNINQSLIITPTETMIGIDKSLDAFDYATGGTIPAVYSLPDTTEPGDPYYGLTVFLALFEGVDEQTTYTSEDIGARTATFVGNAKLDTAVTPKFNATTSAIFDGAGDSIQFPDSDDWWFKDGDFTLEAWVYFAVGGSSANRCIMSQFGPTNANRGFQWLYTSTGQFQFYGYTNNTGGSVVVSTSTITGWVEQTWYHLALVRDSVNGEIRFYRDGTLLETETFASGTYLHNATGTLQIGIRDTLYSWSGNIEGVRITKGYQRYTGASYTTPTAAFPTSATPVDLWLGKQAGGHTIRLVADEFEINAPIRIEERAAAPADDLGYGQVWVRNDDPNTLMFTDDLGNDYVVGGGSFAGLENVVEDGSPQLGGNLDVQTFEINTSTVDGNITLTPNGTGIIDLNGVVLADEITVGDYGVTDGRLRVEHDADPPSLTTTADDAILIGEFTSTSVATHAVINRTGINFFKGDGAGNRTGTGVFVGIMSYVPSGWNLIFGASSSSGTVSFAGGGEVGVRDAGTFRIYNAADDDYAQFSHDGTDFNTSFTAAVGTTDWNVTGLAGFNVGNYNFDVDQTVGAGQDNYVLTYDNATGLISLEEASGGGIADGTVTNSSVRWDGSAWVEETSFLIDSAGHPIMQESVSAPTTSAGFASLWNRNVGAGRPVWVDDSANEWNMLMAGEKNHGTPYIYAYTGSSTIPGFLSRQSGSGPYFRGFTSGFTTATSGANTVELGPNGNIYMEGVLRIEENAAPASNVAAVGQVWVRNDAPNTLVFRDDVGTDFEIAGNLSAPNQLYVTDDAGRPAAGTAGRIFFNTTDGNLNIDDGTNWILPDGTTT